MRRVCYLSGPYSDASENVVWQNIFEARKVARELWKKGWAVICPHMNTAFMGGDDLGHDDFMEGDLELLERSDAVVMMPGWEGSKGAQIEWNRAADLHLPIFYWPDMEDGRVG